MVAQAEARLSERERGQRASQAELESQGAAAKIQRTVRARQGGLALRDLRTVLLAVRS